MTSVGRVWAIAALSRPLLEAGCGGLERERGFRGGLEGMPWGEGAGAQPGLLAKGKLQPAKRKPSARGFLGGAGWVAAGEGREMPSRKKAHPIRQREQPDVAGRGSQIPVN